MFLSAFITINLLLLYTIEMENGLKQKKRNGFIEKIETFLNRKREKNTIYVNLSF